MRCSATCVDTGPFDVAVGHVAAGDDPHLAADSVASWAEAGATWWIEPLWMRRWAFEEMSRRLRQGPPAA